MRALVADDDRAAAAIVARGLTSWGFEVIVANEGTTAWHLLCEQTPSLAVIDWEMPGLDGTELCRRIRSTPALAHLYVVLLTARSSRIDVVSGLESGADDYLVKPVDPHELRARVQVGARVVALQERLAEKVKELETSLARVKQLGGLLPICCYCKRIRNDHNYWERVEVFVTEHSNAKFTHGICPSCFEAAKAQLTA
ncbi:MAG TPA: response regulator [Vicinamibacterales bacterium]|nr:response regulator [Vicinamibacterales bacterium]